MGRRKRKKFKQFNFRVNPRFVWVGSFCLLGVILLSCLMYSIYSSSVFKLTEESIESDLPLNRNLKEKIKGKSLFTVDLEPISSRLVKEYPEYKEIYIFKKFPSSLIIKAKKRKVFAQIKAKRFFPVDKEAIVIDSGSKTPLPGIISIEISDYKYSLRKGKVIDDKRLDYAFNLIKTLKVQDFFDLANIKLINSTKLDALYFIVSSQAFAGGDEAKGKDIKIIIGKDEFAKKIELLRSAMDQQIKDKIDSVEYIDLRYKKVYVGFRR